MEFICKNSLSRQLLSYKRSVMDVWLGLAYTSVNIYSDAHGNDRYICFLEKETDLLLINHLLSLSVIYLKRS